MQPYNHSYNGSVTSVTKTQMVTNPRTAGYRVLSCPTVVVKGNFKSPNAWSYNLIDSVIGMGSSSSYISNVWSSTSIGAVGTEAQAFADVSGITQQTRAQAISRLNGKTRGNLDLATSIAEGGQTVKMLNLTRRFTDSIASMKRSYLKRVWSRFYQNQHRRGLDRALRQWQKGVKTQSRFNRKYYRSIPIEKGIVQRASAAGANGWLEFTYGWRPLVSDIHGLASQTVGRVRNVQQRFKASSSMQINETRKHPASSGNPPLIQKASGSVSVTFGVKMKMGFDPSLSRFTSLNPVSVAYELLPYSFVLDWFFDLGSYMRNLETAMLFQSQFEQGYESTLVTVNYEQSSSGTSLSQGGNYIQNSWTARKKVVTFSRVLMDNYPTTSFPKLRLDLGSSQLLSAASLLRQLIK